MAVNPGRPRTVRILLGVLLAIVLGACNVQGQGTPLPVLETPDTVLSPNPTGVQMSAIPTEPPELPVKVISQALVPDMQGKLHVVGEVRNESGQNVTAVVLTLVAQDAAGVSVIKTGGGEVLLEVTFAPFVADLANGQTAPFDYALPEGVSAPALLQIFVSSFTPLNAELLPLQVEHVQVMTGQGGEAVMVGELVNQNPVAVSVSSTAAILRDEENVHISVGKASVLPGMLQPAGDSLNQDRAPFKIPFYTALPQGATWQVFTNVVQTDPVDTSMFAIDQAVNVYADSQGRVHLVSSLRNNAERAFTVQILAGVYSITGSVLDDGLILLPVDLAPGEELPFDISGFNLLDGRAAQQARLDQYTLQVDAARTIPSEISWQKLAAEGNSATQEEQGMWIFKGRVTNTSGADLQKMVVIAVLKNNSTGALAAVSSAELVNPAGSIPSGVYMDYSIEVMADPASSDALKPEVLVFGAGG